jgi:ABC-type transport system substrate-binding protein
MSPLPPGIFGHAEGEAGINPVVYEWRDGEARRKPIEAAQKLLAEAGWPNGRDARTGEPLVLYLDTTGGGVDDKPRNDWLTRQFAKLGIQLVVRPSDWNRFQEKLRTGAMQIYFLGWNADYPDPENFFFLLSGSEAKVSSGGENTSNYIDAEYDRLFAEMKDMDDTPRRAKIIRRMTRVAQEDAPWIFGFYPKSYTLAHVWLYGRKPHDVANNTLKYQRIDVAERARLRKEWNAPVLWPLAALAAALAAVAATAMTVYRRRERQTGRTVFES